MADLAKTVGDEDGYFQDLVNRGDVNEAIAELVRTGREVALRHFSLASRSPSVGRLGTRKR